MQADSGIKFSKRTFPILSLIVTHNLTILLSLSSSFFIYRRHFDSVLATKKHSIVLLTRTPKPSLTDKGIDVRTVDYTDHSSLVPALQGVHTVISTISAHFPEEQYKSEIALLEAAKEAGVKRFAPSEYAGKVCRWISCFVLELCRKRECSEFAGDVVRLVYSRVMKA